MHQSYIFFLKWKTFQEKTNRNEKFCRWWWKFNIFVTTKINKRYLINYRRTLMYYFLNLHFPAIYNKISIYISFLLIFFHSSYFISLIPKDTLKTRFYCVIEKISFIKSFTTYFTFHLKITLTTRKCLNYYLIKIF